MIFIKFEIVVCKNVDLSKFKAVADNKIYEIKKKNVSRKVENITGNGEIAATRHFYTSPQPSLCLVVYRSKLVK